MCWCLSIIEPFTCLQVKLYSKTYLTLAVYNLLYRTYEYLNTALNSLILDSNMYPFFICFLFVKHLDVKLV